MLLLLVVVLGFLLGEGIVPGRVLFSNDGPLGRLISECHHLPSRFFGCWHDINSIGYRDGSAVPSVSYGLEMGLGVLWFAKLYAPLALLFLGVSVWLLLREMGLGAAACLLGGLAATLNSVYFSSACWGMGAHPIMVALECLALAALARPAAPRRWLRVALAGFAVGMGVVEGADIGAIFSLLVSGFVIYQALVLERASLGNFGLGLARVALMAVCAAFLAAASVGDLLVNNVENVVAAGAQETRSEGGHWDWATQWSLPKVETLGIIVPGLFGYRTDSPNGAGYWGATGRHAAWDRYFAAGSKGAPPQALMRYVGGGNYAGVVVVLVAAWAATQSLRLRQPLFDPDRNKVVWLWAAVAVVALLFSFGRFAPFYRLVYALPYFRTIRNPVKFLHLFSLALTVLFALGVDGLWKYYLRAPVTPRAGRRVPAGSWWSNLAAADRAWVLAGPVVFGLGLAGWAWYSASRPELEKYLATVLFTPATAAVIALFSVDQVGWFVLFYGLAAAWLVLTLAGAFSGSRAVFATVLLGLLVVVDLGRANLPWIRSWDYTEKYASNPIIDLLRSHPYENRVANLPRDMVNSQFQQTFRVNEKMAASEMVLFKLIDFEWIQQLFGYYNIQTLNLVQLSRKPADLKLFEETFTPQSSADLARIYPRYWQLTNTRYLLGENRYLAFLNGNLDPAQHRFRIVQRFNLRPKGGRATPLDWSDFNAVPDANGDYALFEFLGALPRAKLYAKWQTAANEDDAIHLISDLAHDPEQTVVVSGAVPAPAATAAPGQDAGTVEFASYAPKRVVLNAAAKTTSVLLLNDRTDAGWRVLVDGQPQALLRCNYLMRGVLLNPGNHTVEFRFSPPHQALYVSFAGVGAGLAVLGVVVWGARARPARDEPAVERAARPKGARKNEAEARAKNGAAK